MTIIEQLTMKFRPVFEAAGEGTPSGNTPDGGTPDGDALGGDDTVKGGEDTVKGGEDTVKGGEDTVKGGEDTVKGGEDDDDDVLGGGEEDEADEVPEGDYAFEMPEGMELDADLAAKVAPVMKELGLGQKAASKLVEAYAGAVQDQVDQIADAYVNRLADQLKTAKADSEIGGSNWGASKAAANQFIQKFGTPELVAEIRESGMQNNPELIRAFARAGKAVASDQSPDGGTVDNKEVPPEQVWYPTTPTKKGG